MDKDKDNEQSSLKKSNKRHLKNAPKKVKRIKNYARKRAKKKEKNQ